jgi:hypothetical protein
MSLEEVKLIKLMADVVDECRMLPSVHALPRMEATRHSVEQQY